MQVFMTRTYPQTVADLLYGGRFLLRFSDCVLVDFILDGYVSCLPFLVDLRNIFGLYDSGDRGLIPLSGLKNTPNYYVKRLLIICLLQLKLGYHKVLGTNRYTSFYPKMRYILFFYNHKIVLGFVYLKDFAGESIKLCYI